MSGSIVDGRTVITCDVGGCQASIYADSYTPGYPVPVTDLRAEACAQHGWLSFDDPHPDGDEDYCPGHVNVPHAYAPDA